MQYSLVNCMAMSGKYNILKKTFDEYVLKEGDVDSREPEDLLQVEPTVDSRGRYAFSE